MVVNVTPGPALRLVTLLSILLLIPFAPDVGADSTYRQEREYVGGFPLETPFGGQSLCIDPPGSPFGVAGGCNFMCPVDRCRITVTDDALQPRFRVCPADSDCPNQPVRSRTAVVNVGANELFTVHIDVTGTHGRIVVTLP